MSKRILFYIGNLSSRAKTLYLVTAIFIIALPANSHLVYSQTMSDLQREAEKLQRENANNLSAVEKLREVATSYESAIDILKHDIHETEVAISVSIERQRGIESEILQAEAELSQQKDLLGKNIRAIYIEGEMSTIEMLASSNDLSEYIDKQQYRETIKAKIQSTMDRIEMLKVQLGEQKAQVEIEIKEQNESKALLVAARAEQNRLLSLNKSEQDEFNRQTKTNEAKIAQLKAAQEELARQISAGSLVSQGPVKKGDVVGRVGNTGFSTGAHLHFEARNSSGNDVNPSSYIGKGWIRPVEGGYVSQGYGVANSWYIKGYHAGIDYAGVTGRPVLAVADGEIVWRGCKGSCNASYGNYVLIKHADGMFSLYAHLAL